MGTIEDVLGQVLGQSGNPQGGVATASQQGQPGGDQLTNLVVQALGADKADANPILAAIASFVQKNGGIPGIIQKFQKSGLAEKAGSWLSTGSNEALTPQQIGQVFDEGSIQGLAKDLNTTPEKAKKTLAETLPELVNQFSPGGALPENADELLGSFTQLLGAQKPR
jgi:uncharacterized protein YidB (DUF937 family)